MLCVCGCGQETSGKINSNTREPSRYVSGHNARGAKRSPGQRQRMADAQRGKVIPESARLAISGSRNPHWKGNEASYSAVHIWRRHHRPKAGLCGKCGTAGKTHWANISGRYVRDEDSDWLELCPRCHRVEDGHIGEGHPQARLTEALVLQARVRYANGDSYRSIAAEYGVHMDTVYLAVKRKTWRHLP